MSLNLAAWTRPGEVYPPYISINRIGEEVRVTVRAAAKPDGSCGDGATISMTLDQYNAFVKQITNVA